MASKRAQHSVDIGAQPCLDKLGSGFEIMMKIQGQFYSTLGDEVLVQGSKVLFNKVAEREQIVNTADGRINWKNWV